METTNSVISCNYRNNEHLFCRNCNGKRDLCVNPNELGTNRHEKWDVFIAYHGGVDNGTELYAKELYNRINGTLLSNGHQLKVYQHSTVNENCPFGQTQKDAQNSQVFILLADSRIPTYPGSGAASGEYLGCELVAFDLARDGFPPCLENEPVCLVIACDDKISNDDAQKLHTMFTGSVILRWNELQANDFRDLTKLISRVLIDDENVPSPIPEFDISKIGAGAQKRLRKHNDKPVEYECLKELETLDEGLSGDFCKITYDENEYELDAELSADIDAIIDKIDLPSTNKTHNEEIYQLKWMGIDDGNDADNIIYRVQGLQIVNDSNEKPILTLQPVHYKHCLHMLLLDTQFSKKETTLRKKYANPIEENTEILFPNRLTHHIGCGAFVITKDGYLIYADRRNADRLTFYPGKLGYTASGAWRKEDGNLFDFINRRIKKVLEREDNFENLYLWELGYEYEYLHYQFSFLHFSDKNHDDDRIKTQNSQATEFVKLNLKQVENLADALKIPALWELSAWAVLTSALKSELFVEAVEKHCGFKFDKEGFIKLLEG